MIFIIPHLPHWQQHHLFSKACFYNAVIKIYTIHVCGILSLAVKRLLHEHQLSENLLVTIFSAIDKSFVYAADYNAKSFDTCAHATAISTEPLSCRFHKPRPLVLSVLWSFTWLSTFYD